MQGRQPRGGVRLVRRETHRFPIVADPAGSIGPQSGSPCTALVGSLMAGDSAFIAISTSKRMAYLGSCSKVRSPPSSIAGLKLSSGSGAPAPKTRTMGVAVVEKSLKARRLWHFSGTRRRRGIERRVEILNDFASLTAGEDQHACNPSAR
jgi:hypothetical protein